MNFINGNIKTLYRKYLVTAFGSALITSIYSIVDMAMVGQYQGPTGTAALAVVAPIWNIIYSLGLLMGIGGSVIFATIKGRTGTTSKEANEVYTVAFLGAMILAALAWVAILCFDQQLLMFFGAKEELLALATSYMIPIKFVLPCFLFTQMMAAFLRNDNAPTLATIAVLSGGIFNIVGDYLFVFVFDMGIFGAGLATAIGSIISCLVMISHFFTKQHTLAFVKPTKVWYRLKKISITGFSTFFIDVAMGILTILFNRQIVTYLGVSALSIYGVIVTVSTFVQCCAYSIGQASQPIISVNFGARLGGRIKEILLYAMYTVAFFSFVWTLVSLCFPNALIHLFMTPTNEILTLAPFIIGTYGLSFLCLPLNIFSTYYFQAILKPRASFVVAVARGLVVSGLLILLLPTINERYLWYAMPLTELLVAIYASYALVRYTKTLPMKEEKAD